MNETPIRRRAKRFPGGATYLLLTALVVGCSQESEAPGPAGPAASQTPSLAVAEPAPAGETVQLTSCDGENTVAVSKESTGQALADALMDQWTRDHPEADWVAEEKEKHAFQPPADNSDLLQGDQGKGHAYGNYTELDVLTWAREAEKFVAEGSRIFHSGDELGSTVAVSCDMCHPHAANTHPETYPKFQAQLGRVALLRDMINWCIENPVRGDKLDADDANMRALEAYITALRTGVEMYYGKHYPRGVKIRPHVFGLSRKTAGDHHSYHYQLQQDPPHETVLSRAARRRSLSRRMR